MSATRQDARPPDPQEAFRRVQEAELRYINAWRNHPGNERGGEAAPLSPEAEALSQGMTGTPGTTRPDGTAAAGATMQGAAGSGTQLPLAGGAGRPLTGLALSGGGIRSAVYCLGVLQALAAEGVLRRFDYLSTVSGGGYIGTALTWFTRAGKAPEQDPCGAHFPLGRDDPAMFPREDDHTERSVLKHLRRHGSYLIPGHGITLGSGISIVLRGVLLNLLVWMPAAVTACLILRGIARGLRCCGPRGVEFWLHPLALAFYALLVFVAIGAAYSLRSFPRRGSGRRDGIPYALRRRFEIWTPWLLLTALALAVLGSLPLLAPQWGPGAPAGGWPLAQWLLGPGATLLGAATGLWARFVQRGTAARERPGWVGPVGAVLVFYGLALVSWGLAGWALRGHLWWLPPVLVLVSIPVGLRVNLNYTTLHRFYRDRLMEAFMPDFTVQPGPPPNNEVDQDGQADAAENAPLSAMCDEAAPAAPYHLLNTHLVITRSPHRRLRLRGGDSFVLSPRFCGSWSTGWYPTETFMRNDLTLATAMAISGAAVNPDAANAGVGPQRSWAFALLMSFLNIRLGCWVPNPDERKAGQTKAANHFDPGLVRAIRGHRVEDPLLELTDGGNFENLGVYELLRRRVRTILVCDATADPRYAFSDLQNLLSRAEADFRVKIDFGDQPLGDLLPALGPGYPSGIAWSGKPFVCATITYPPLVGEEPEFGELFYLKPAIYSGLGLELKGYKGTFPDFPNDPTADQFFDEARFEAYRELGFLSTRVMLDGTCAGHGRMGEGVIRDRLRAM
ncbi:patatin-like phospholipase family protein [Roseomonas elaeocarpi]|uniref:Patatin-like phospholipase family protein n=1 Tax=Roseomonas elaeocarpi TaxID=907779 RepID=A0ABV6JVX7_9PROT